MTGSYGRHLLEVLDHDAVFDVAESVPRYYQTQYGSRT